MDRPQAVEAPWWRRPPLADAAIAVAVAAVLVVQVAVAMERGARSPDAVAYTLATAMGLLLLWRRPRPGVVLLITVAAVFGYHALGYPAIGIALPMAVGLFTVAHQGRTSLAVVVTVVTVGGTLAWLLAGESTPPLSALSTVVREAAIMVAVLLAGTAFRSRRLLAEESRERTRLARAEQAATAERRMVAERMRIAHELHDVVAHTVALIGVQARVAGEALDDSPQAARAALDVIKRATRDATAELRATVGVLRAGTPTPLQPLPRLDQLDGLVASVRSGGLAVDLQVEGTPRPLPGSVELAAYRVIQEALTNVVRHADATRATVRVNYRPDVLGVTVRDDGTGVTTSTAAEGHGITGMRERVGAVGGELTIGPDGDGYAVVARLPLGSR